MFHILLPKHSCLSPTPQPVPSNARAHGFPNFRWSANGSQDCDHCAHLCRGPRLWLMNVARRLEDLTRGDQKRWILPWVLPFCRTTRTVQMEHLTQSAGHRGTAGKAAELESRRGWATLAGLTAYLVSQVPSFLWPWPTENPSCQLVKEGRTPPAGEQPSEAPSTAWRCVPYIFK